ncbi:hypothetical protein OSTOST_04587, partial [Ostertagia ostertagi]
MGPVKKSAHARRRWRFRAINIKHRLESVFPNSANPLTITYASAKQPKLPLTFMLSKAAVVGGSLADRAGLRDGDIIDQLEGLGNLDINAVDRLLVTSRDKIELVVH